MVGDESAALARLPGTLAQAVLQQRQRQVKLANSTRAAYITAGMWMQMIGLKREAWPVVV
jgi:hypothetical protein